MAGFFHSNSHLRQQMLSNHSALLACSLPRPDRGAPASLVFTERLQRWQGKATRPLSLGARSTLSPRQKKHKKGEGGRSSQPEPALPHASSRDGARRHCQPGARQKDPSGHKGGTAYF